MVNPQPPSIDATGPSKGRVTGIVFVMVLLVAVFSSLGVWQVERLSWKLDLIARVDQRVHAEPQPIPAEKDWRTVNTAADEYRHVVLSGRFLHDKEVLVYASTERGPGYWVMTPMQLDSGAVVFVNRGFVPPDRRARDTRQAGELQGPVNVTGLMRMNEPKGTLLRSNDPKDDRWYSRDVEAMGASRGLTRVAPFFVDADSTPNPGGLPVGGLTIIHFRNSHLTYAVTWFTLALLSIAAGVIALRAERRLR